MSRHGLVAAVALAALPAAGQEAELTVRHGISAFGPLKYGPDFAHFDYVVPAAPQGGELSFRGAGASRTFDSLNQFILAGEPAQGLERLYDSLLVASADEPDSAYGQIAATVAYPEDRSFAIYTMRPEARFTDGHPITAEDVVWTLRTLKEDGSPTYRIQLHDMAGVEALGEHRVRVDFAEGAHTRDLPSEIGQIPVLPKHYYAQVAFDRSTLQPPVGSGAFVVDEVNAGRSIRYCKTDDYWGADLPVNVGLDNFDCVLYEYFADTTAAFEALKSGTYLFHEEFSSQLWATGYDFPAVENGWVARDEVEDARPSGTQGFWLNMRREKLQDPRVREAIGLLFNFKWANETLFYGLYERTDSFFENSTMQAEGMLDGEELAFLEQFRDQLPEAVFAEPAYTPPEGSSQKTDRGAVREAAALLREAGWTSGPDGVRRNADGEALTLNFVTDSAAFSRIVLPFIDNLERAGIDAEFVQVDPAQMQQRQETFNYDMTVARLVMSLSPSAELRTLFGSDSAEAQGTFNLAGVADPAVDAIIEAIIDAGSREEMETRVRALDRVLRAKHIWVPNWYKGEHWLAYWDVFGRPAAKPPYARGDAAWWFAPARRAALIEEGAPLR